MRLFKRGAAHGMEGSSSKNSNTAFGENEATQKELCSASKGNASAPEKSTRQEQEKTRDGCVRRHFIISGRVQGVGFRYTAYQVANTYGLTGWVCNCYDGTVEMEVQGPEEMVNTFLKRMQLMNKWMRVEHVEESDRPVTNESGFRERY